ncbi:hypothetical protein [Blastococcus sp. SYSU D01042]
MTDATRTRIESLHHRASLPGAAAVPWPAVRANLESIRARRGEDWSTLGLAVDGWVTAAEDEWSVEVADAVEHLGWGEEWNPRSPRFLVHAVTGNEARGFVSGVKGALFESQVADRAEAGDIDLPDGADSLKLAADLQQPGWDAELLEAGEVIGVVQMKATSDLGYLKEHFERYPDISEVIATSEVAGVAAVQGLPVTDGGITNDALERTLEDAVDSLEAASLMHEVLPVVGLGALALRGRQCGAQWRVARRNRVAGQTGGLQPGRSQRTRADGGDGHGNGHLAPRDNHSGAARGVPRSGTTRGRCPARGSVCCVVRLAGSSCGSALIPRPRPHGRRRCGGWCRSDAV